MSAATEKENRKYFLDRGYCPTCHGKRKVEPGRKQCAVCLEIKRNREKRRADRLRAEGRCSRCGAPMGDDTHATCEKCRQYSQKYTDKGNERLKSIYHDRKNHGLCVRCGSGWVHAGRSLCPKCLELCRQENKRYDPDGQKRRERIARRRAEGLCIDCGKPAAEGYTRCGKCMSSRRDSTRKYTILQNIKREAEKARNHGQVRQQ